MPIVKLLSVMLSKQNILLCVYLYLCIGRFKYTKVGNILTRVVMDGLKMRNFIIPLQAKGVGRENQ